MEMIWSTSDASAAIPTKTTNRITLNLNFRKLETLNVTSAGKEKTTNVSNSSLHQKNKCFVDIVIEMQSQCALNRKDLVSFSVNKVSP